MDPVTFGTISAITSIAGTGISALGAISGGNAAAAQASYGAQVAANNEIIARQKADYAIRAGEARAADQGLKNREIAGKVRAGLAASGLDVNSGSAVDLRQTRAELGTTDVERVRTDAELRAYGYRSRAGDFAAQAELGRAGADNSLSAGWLKAGGTLLSGLSSFAPKFGGFGSNKDSEGEFGSWSARS